ncbi:MAG: OmpA family protein [Planctomycetes bacterium]|nr:OmpA family protein [Planctomycetota bacterium]
MKTLPLVATLGCGLLLASCGARDISVANEELLDENQRLTAAVKSGDEENKILAKQRDDARLENVRLKEQIAGIQQQLTGIIVGGPLGISGNKITVSNDLAFASGSATLNKDARSALKSLANQLNGSDFSNTLVIVEGHTDTTPVVKAATVDKFGNNFGLSAARAAAVASQLVKSGISPKRIRGAFRGEHAPKAGASKKENRRVDIFLHVVAE